MALKIKKVDRQSLLKGNANNGAKQLFKMQFQMMKEAMLSREISYVVDLRFED